MSAPDHDAARKWAEGLRQAGSPPSGKRWHPETNMAHAYLARDTECERLREALALVAEQTASEPIRRIAHRGLGLPPDATARDLRDLRRALLPKRDTP